MLSHHRHKVSLSLTADVTLLRILSASLASISEVIMVDGFMSRTQYSKNHCIKTAAGFLF